MKRSAEFFIGSTLSGGFRLKRSLGEGGFGIAFEAYTDKSAIPVAVKVYNRSADLLAVATVAEEAITLAQLKHPHIVPFIRFGVHPLQLRDARGLEITEYYPFFVMKYANSGDVRRLKPRESITPLLPAQVVDIIFEAASGVQFAHDAENAYVHRDLKPENLLRYRNPATDHIDVWVADFGISIVAHTLGSLEPQGSVGTPPYMAPEQFRGKAIRESDQYALGVIAYELLTGKRPFEGEHIDPNANDMEKFLQWESIQRNEIPQPISDKLRKSGQQHLMSKILEALEPVILQALAKEPIRRFGSVRQFAATLKEAQVKATEAQGKERKIFELVVLEKQKQQKLYSLVEKGMQLSRGKRYEEALIVCDDAIKLDSENSSVLFLMEIVLNQLRKYGESRDSYEQAAKIFPAYGIGSIQPIRIYEELLGIYDQLIKNDPVIYYPYARKIKILATLGRFNEAIRVIKDAGKDAGSINIASVPLSSRGIVYYKVGQHQDGLMNIEHATKYNPQDWTTYYYKGEIMKGEDNLEEAITAYEKAIELCTSEMLKKDIKRIKEGIK